MKNISVIIIAVILIAGCKNGPDEADAYGNFEATEVIVSAETSGRILSLGPAEGSQTEKGAALAVIDSTMLCLQAAEIDAGIRSVKTRLASFDAQNEILNQQLINLEINIRRFENMLKDDAATKKQYDDLTGQAEVIRKQIAANNVQKTSTAAEIFVFESKKATVMEQVRRCTVRSPLNGTVIEKYAEAGEIISAGRPLVKIADLTVMKLKVYVSGAQLGSIATGSECQVRIDEGNKGYMNYTGTVSYISEKAEFTPKIIQTKEERVTLVYAVNIDVPNDGSLKSGMPGEAIF